MAGEWKRYDWGEIATLEYGKSLQDYRSESGRYRVYGTNGPIGYHEKPLCTHPGVIVGRKGAYRGIHYSPKPFFVIDTAFYLEPKQEMNLRWAYYCLLTYDINGMDSGSAIPSTSREAFYRLPVRVPPLKEQQAIACILGALDGKIELNRQMNRTLEEMARVIFKSWFVDFDPVRAKAAVRREHPGWSNDQVSRVACPNLKPEIAALFPDSFEDSELGEIPKGWSVESLDKTAHFLNGLALQKYPPTGEETLPVIKIAQLRSGNTTGADRCNTDLPAEYVVEDGDVLFSWSGSLECVLWAGDNGALNQHLFKVTSAQYPKWFYYLWIHHHLPQFRHIAADKATTMGHIQRHHLSYAKVMVPSQPLDGWPNDLLGPIIERIVHNNIQSRTLAALRDTLLPKLTSGELRVPDTERIAGRCI
jgi:type I restriction enzyme, S subunit